MLSHSNLVAETMIPAVQSRAWAAEQIAAGGEVAEFLQNFKYKTLAHLPVSHIAGLFGYLISPSASGGAVYWMRKYSWKPLLEYMKKYEITVFYTVPSIYLRIARSPDVTDQFSYMTAAATGAAVMDADLQNSADKRLGTGETFIFQTYGSSETTGAVTQIGPGEKPVPGTLGPVVPNMELRIVDDNFKVCQSSLPHFRLKLTFHRTSNQARPEKPSSEVH